MVGLIIRTESLKEFDERQRIVVEISVMPSFTQGKRGRTVLSSIVSRLARASMPNIVEMSCTICCVSLELVDLDLS